jgi:acyl carrier protein
MTTERKKLSDAEIVAKTHRILEDQLGVDSEEITPRALLIDDLGADSLDQIEVVMALEEEFGVQIDDADVDGLRTVKDVTDYLTRQLRHNK